MEDCGVEDDTKLEIMTAIRGFDEDTVATKGQKEKLISKVEVFD